MSIQEVQAKINPLLGQKAWGVSLGLGSFLTLEFGEPLPTDDKHPKVHGEWHLWLYNCAWRLEEKDEILTASEDDQDKLEIAIRRLENLTLTSVDLVFPALDAIFIFEHQVVLRLFAIHSEEYEHWLLYIPDGNVLTVGPGNCWSYGSSAAISA
jgi:hypothetical protein